MRKIIVLLSSILLFMSVAQAATTPDWKTDMPVADAMPRITSSVTVNCAAGQSVQAAVDANPSPIDISISGICIEAVMIRDKDVSLRGTTKPSLDGIRSPSRMQPALTMRGPVIGAITGLSFSGNPGTGVSIRGANVTITDSLFDNNMSSGIQVVDGGLVTGIGLGFTNNTGRAINVSDAQLFCTACDVTGASWAVLARRGAVVSLMDSLVSGGRGLSVADGGTRADLDCATANTTHPCGMNVTGVAAQATAGGVAALFDAGDFKGQLMADDYGSVQLIGSRQQSGATADLNTVDSFGSIVVAAFTDVSPADQSRLRSTNTSHFGQILITDVTILAGPIQCSSAGDTWMDPQGVRLPGATISGCDHAK